MNEQQLEAFNSAFDLVFGPATDDHWQNHAHELMQERYRAAVEALNRCAAAGANLEDLKTLAYECGVNPKDIKCN